jgi:hypothetical protein
MNDARRMREKWMNFVECGEHFWTYAKNKTHSCMKLQVLKVPKYPYFKQSKMLSQNCQKNICPAELYQELG